MSLLKKIKTRLAYRLVLYIVLFSGLITLFITAIQLYMEYQRDVRNLDVQFEQIEKSFLPSLSSALWRYNEELIKAQLQGIRKLRDIEQAEVVAGGKVLLSVGACDHEKHISKEFPLKYLFKGQERVLGTLKVSATYSGIYERLYHRLIVILLSSAVKTFFTSFFMLILFGILVIRHLEKVVSYFQSYSLTAPAEPLRLDIKRSDPDKGDELNRIESEINNLIDVIRNSHDAAQKMVAQRTLELENANKTLKAEVRERKTALEHLKVSEKNYKNLVEHSPDILYRFSKKRGSIFVSNRVESILGYSAEYLMQNPFVWRESIHPDYKDVLEKVISEVEEGKTFDFEYRIKDKTDEWHWFRDRSIAIIDDQGGIIIEGLATDITLKKRSDEALKQSEEKYRALVEEINDIIYSTDAKGIVTYISPAVENVMGYATQEIIGKIFLEFVHPDDRQDILERFGMVRDSGILHPYEYRLLSKSGDIHWIRSSSQPIYENGQFEGLRGVYTDITEAKKLEHQLRQAHKMEAIGTLAGGIAHEFNNDLAIILGNAELALDDVPDWNPAKESIEEIRTASLRAKEVIRQILSFARKTMTSLKPIETTTMVKKSLKLMRASLPAMVDIQANIPSEPKMILGDPTEIHQIVINLCTNAANAMKETGGVLEVAISEVTLHEENAARYEDLAPGNFVKLIVKDSGEGIAPDVLEKVFEPYFTTKEFGAGSGMGLAVVYGLVKKFKGAISIKSTVDQGTTVEILFPKIEEEAPAKKDPEGGLPTGNERILLVDDDPSIVNMVRQMLERLGYSVSGMTDSVATLERFKSTPDKYDIVITDMGMPKMSGYQLATELIKVREDIPILLCTGNSDAMDEKGAKEIGIRGFAMKPLDKRKLARAVRTVLDKNSDS